MAYHVIINDKTSKGKELLQIIKGLPETTAKIIEEEEELIPAEQVFAEFKEAVKNEYAKRKKQQKK